MTENSSNLHGQQLKRAFFGRKAGKGLKPSQQALMDDVLPTLSVDTSVACNNRKQLSDLFGELNPDEIWLESGFGGGEHLVFRASENPETGFIGIEPFRNGMVKAVADIDEKALQNVRLHYEEAGPFLDWLPEGSLDGMYLLYPDPWPKKRHWKRRFLNDDNLNRIARVLKPGHDLRFASDIDTYVDWALEHIRRHSAFEWMVATPSDWREPWVNWPSTRYEAKAFREGRTPHYLTFRRV